MRMPVTLSLLLFLPATFLFSALDFKIPDRAKSFLYVKDIRNIEDTLRKSGMTDLPAEYFTYLLDYLKDDHPAIAAYREFRQADDGDFFKSLLGSMAVAGMDAGPVILVELDSKSRYLSALTSLFQMKGKFRDWNVEVSGGTAMLARDQKALEQYKKSPQSESTLFQDVPAASFDVFLYRRGRVVIHPAIDTWISDPFEEKTGALGIDFAKREIKFSMSARPFAPEGARDGKMGALIPETTLAFADLKQNPYELFARLFGADTVETQEQNLRAAFDNQITFALAGISPSMAPSFIAVLKPLGSPAEGEKALKAFLEGAVGESNWTKNSVGNVTVTTGRNSRLSFYPLGGYLVLCDSDDAVNATLDVLTRKQPSVWEDPAVAKLKDLTAKRAAIRVDFNTLADQILTSMIQNLTLEPKDKDALSTYMQAVRGLGTLVAYGEDRGDRTYFYLVFKKNEK